MLRRDFIRSTALGSLTPFLASATLPPAEPPDDPKVKEIRSRIRPISADERAARRRQAQEHMAALGIDMLICEGGVTLSYFTGVSWGRSERLFAMLLPRDGEPAFVVPKFEEGRAREQLGASTIYTWEEDQSPYALIHQVVTDHKALTGTIALEEYVRYFVTESIGKELPQVRLALGTPVTAGCRSVKSAHELELMQIANDITAEVYKRAVSALKEGITEREFASIVSSRFGDFGVNGGALVLFGEASAYPHGMIRDYTLRENDIVLIDGGCTVEGYNSDVTRTTVLGTPTDKMKRVWEIVHRAQSAALAAAKPGVAAGAIDEAARDVIVKAGYGPDYTYFTHRVGHGIGLEGHEWYYLVRGSTKPVQAGNTFSDEPGIYIPGEFGIRLEDELQITADGARLMLPQASSLTTLF